MSGYQKLMLVVRIQRQGRKLRDRNAAWVGAHFAVGCMTGR